MVQAIRVYVGSRPHSSLQAMACQAEAVYAFNMPQRAGRVPYPSHEYRGVRMCGEPQNGRQRPSPDDSLRRPAMVLDRRLAMGVSSDVKRQVPCE